jgi:uncharacterized protein (DUF1810 family)
MPKIARKVVMFSRVWDIVKKCSKSGICGKERSLTAGINGHPDDLEFGSSMTLFAAAAPEEPLFKAALKRFFGGEHDALAVNLLKQHEQDAKR